MKKKKRIRSLLGITLLMGISAAVIWQVDPLRMNGIPRFLANPDLNAITTPPPAADDESLAAHSASAPDQSASGEAAEPPLQQDFVFETEPEIVAEPVSPQTEFDADELFDSTPTELAADDTTEIVTDVFESDEFETQEIVITPRTRRLSSGHVTSQDSSIITVAGTEPAVQSTATDSAISSEHLLEINQLIENGKEQAAHKRLSAWYWNHPQDRPRFQETMERLAQSIYFSPQPHYEEAYVVQSGDQMRKIAKQYKLSWQYLARLNQVNPRKIRVGQKLKIVNGPFDAVVDLSEYQLTILCRGQFVRQYSVGIGKDGTSPIGKFTVKDKLEDPVYYGPDGVIANDSPDNPLGERWIDIGDSFGIHGTIDPESIGKSESRGCIRMLNNDVAEVYDFLTVGSTVWIRR